MRKILRTLCTIVVLAIPKNSFSEATNSTRLTVPEPAVTPIDPPYAPGWALAPVYHELSEYIIQPGDTLWDIAKTECGKGMDYIELASYNNISNPDKIRVGQKLIVNSEACYRSGGGIQI
jgi:nucleoid-associated protein YgaU